MLTIAICFIILGENGEIEFLLGWKREFSNTTITNEECWRGWKEEKQRDFSVVMGFILFCFVVCSLFLVLLACLLTFICFLLWGARQR